MKNRMKLAMAMTSSVCVCIALNVLPAQALTFENNSGGKFTFFNDGGVAIGRGTFGYSGEPVEGTFVNSTGNYKYPTIFYNDPDDLPSIPDEFIPYKSISIDKNQNLHQVLNVDITFFSGTRYSYKAEELISGETFDTTLFIEPTDVSTLPADSGGFSFINFGDPRSPIFTLDNSGWFLGYSVPPARYFRLYNDGEFFSLDPEKPSFYGTWIAEAVPEPLTLLGAASALGFGIFFKREISKKSNKDKTNV